MQWKEFEVQGKRYASCCSQWVFRETCSSLCWQTLARRQMLWRGAVWQRVKHSQIASWSRIWRSPDARRQICGREYNSLILARHFIDMEDGRPFLGTVLDETEIYCISSESLWSFPSIIDWNFLLFCFAIGDSIICFNEFVLETVFLRLRDFTYTET